jgi:hypothetical protein
MNERPEEITKLTKQAGIKFGKNFVYTDYNELSGHSFSPAVLAKFAALIWEEAYRKGIDAGMDLMKL